MDKKNIFQGIPHELQEEFFETVTETDSFRLERIVSRGHSTSEGEWYDQEQDEWVILLKGRAELLFEEGSRRLEMGPGDHVLIHSHQRHRVEWTSEDEDTVWLALHFS